MPRASKSKEDAPPKREKKVKDPNAPKKPCGAYMWFCKERRGEVKEEHPEYGVTDIGKVLGAMWKEISEEEKSKFHKLGQQDRERYQKELEEYENEKGE